MPQSYLCIYLVVHCTMCRVSHQLGCEFTVSHCFLLTPIVVVSSTVLLRLAVMEYHTSWIVSLFCDCATVAAEQDSPAIRFSWYAAQSTAGRAPQRPSHLDHFRSLAWTFGYHMQQPRTLNRMQYLADGDVGESHQFSTDDGPGA